MKRFMFLSIGVMCLAVSALVGFHVGNRTAQATAVMEPVGNIVAMYESTVLTADGRIWTFDVYNTKQWIESQYSPVPIPVTDIQFIDNGNAIQLVDKNGDVWNCNSGNPWTNVGHPPPPPVSTDMESWGGVKGQYGKKGD